MMLDDLKKKFKDRYEEEPTHIYFAPGRVNIIGEHIDYNGGLVLPFTTNYGTYLLMSIRGDKLVKYASTNFECCGEDDVNNANKHLNDWVKYPAGVLVEMSDYWMDFLGADVLFSGDIPLAAGLSSSASIQIVTAFAANEINDCRMSPKELAVLCQNSEIKHIGVNCGIMDQYVVAMGKKDTALLIDCDKVTHNEIIVDLGDYKFVVANTNKPRKLVDSKYNERRAECEKALALISTRKKINNLCELSSLSLEEYKFLFTDDVLWRRAVHVVKENERVLLTANALVKGHLNFVGRKMNESHDSLKDNYEVTGFELDTLVEEARKIVGVLGSRMTGGGFGGCTISLVHKDSIDVFKERVGKSYFEKTGFKADFYITEMCEGVRRIE